MHHIALGKLPIEISQNLLAFARSYRKINPKDTNDLNVASSSSVVSGLVSSIGLSVLISSVLIFV